MVSGGQTGADPAALDWALYRGIECGGWCPKGRKAEDGPIAKRYPLIETPTQSTILVQCDRSLEAEHVWNRPRWPGEISGNSVGKPRNSQLRNVSHPIG